MRKSNADATKSIEKHNNIEVATNLFIAIGTHRSKAESWIAELPARFPRLEIQTIRREEIAGLPENPEGDHLVVVGCPYSDIVTFQEDVRTAAAKGFQVYIQYFPAEPLFTLIQEDMKYRENALGAAVLKEEIATLRTEQGYRQVLEKENPLATS